MSVGWPASISALASRALHDRQLEFLPVADRNDHAAVAGKHTGVLEVLGPAPLRRENKVSKWLTSLRSRLRSDGSISARALLRRRVGGSPRSQRAAWQPGSRSRRHPSGPRIPRCGPTGPALLGGLVRSKPCLVLRVLLVASPASAFACDTVTSDLELHPALSGRIPKNLSPEKH